MHQTQAGSEWHEQNKPTFAKVGLGFAYFHVAPDGKRAALLLPEGEENQKPITHLTLLLNFFDELQRKAPVK